jgi:hypothetical protein
MQEEEIASQTPKAPRLPDRLPDRTTAELRPTALVTVGHSGSVPEFSGDDDRGRARADANDARAARGGPG